MFKRDRLLPGVALIAVVAVALVVVALLRSASMNGTRALEDLKVGQVQSTANSFSARIGTSFASIGGLGARPWQLTRGSAADQTALNAFAIDPQAISGFFLVDAADTITSGVLLRPGQLGPKYDPANWERLKTALASAPATVLPVVTSGVTTELPSYAFAVAIRGKSPTSIRGAFVFEQALTQDSAFNKEIAASQKSGGSAALRFLDTHGTVVATSLPAGLGAQVPDKRLIGLTDGLHKIGGNLVVSAAVPSIGWRVVFTQRESEFVRPLAGPLQSAGLVLVLLLLVIGIVLTAALARRLQQARETEKRLRELHGAQEEFISVVSHELRTPVAGVLGFLQTTLDHWSVMTDGERHDAVRRAFTNARRLQAMARDVLDTESIESGQFGYLSHPIDLVEEVRTAAASFDEGTNRVTLTVPGTEVVMDGDADRIQQVLSNLIDNSLKFSTEDNAVEVSLEQIGAVARITVLDHGSGIDPDQLTKIFDKFVRAREGTVTGTGLGLYISRRIVEAHGGRIWAESSPGENTRFVVELPCRTPVPGS
ncbi:MAG: sensor histidine kinase [Marmoricola sp.]|nr:sensor histidine kinase [Marmoricola sp.]